MSMRWRDTMSIYLREVLEKTKRLDDDLAVGAKIILADSDKRVPKEHGRLVASGVVKRDRSGNNAVGIVYGGPYARWVHEHVHFKHPRGGQAKFLETALLEKGREAINEAGRHLWERL
ncbi:hypothetical protein GCM10027053_51980 [Intrasporangium mesophilum]